MAGENGVDVEWVVFVIPVLFIVMFFLIVALALRYSAKSEEMQHELEMTKARTAMAQQDAETSATKTIVKEVIMIPCKYCGTLIPQTASSCPHCGASKQA